MAEEAVIEQRLAVIGEDNDEAVVIDAHPLQAGDQLADQPVVIGDGVPVGPLDPFLVARIDGTAGNRLAVYQLGHAPMVIRKMRSLEVHVEKGRTTPRVRLDRKSTRLNSSH